jgi:hypothetical protein
MIRDARTTFASAVSVAAVAGTAVFGNYIDRTTTPNFDQARLYLQIWCTTTFVAAGAGTVQFDLISSAATSGSSPNLHIQSPLFATATVASVAPLVAGDPILMAEVPRGSGIVGIATYLRYIMMQCVTATNTTSAGSVSAFLSLETGYWAALPNASQ